MKCILNAFSKGATWTSPAELLRYPPNFMNNLTIVLALVAASIFSTAHCEVEYQYYDTFSVLSEPSFSIDEDQPGDDILTEHIVILRDSIDRDDARKDNECVFFDANASVTWQTPDSMPVLYIYSKCGTSMEISFRDIKGQEWQKSKLVPLKRNTLKNALEQLTGNAKPDLNPDRHVMIAEYAICNGIVPRPKWFKKSCE